MTHFERLQSIRTSTADDAVKTIRFLSDIMDREIMTLESDEAQEYIREINAALTNLKNFFK